MTAGEVSLDEAKIARNRATKGLGSPRPASSGKMQFMVPRGGLLGYHRHRIWVLSGECRKNRKQKQTSLHADTED
jgi:hypothetical protein